VRSRTTSNTRYETENQVTKAMLQSSALTALGPRCPVLSHQRPISPRLPRRRLRARLPTAQSPLNSSDKEGEKRWHWLGRHPLGRHDHHRSPTSPTARPPSTVEHSSNGASGRGRGVDFEDAEHDVALLSGTVSSTSPECAVVSDAVHVGHAIESSSAVRSARRSTSSTPGGRSRRRRDRTMTKARRCSSRTLTVGPGNSGGPAFNERGEDRRHCSSNVH
jgi:hypothetical protein